MTDHTPTLTISRPPPGERSKRERAAERRSTMILLAPALVFLTLMSIWPFAYLIYASFTSYQLAVPIPIEWVGFDNFTKLLSGERFWSSLGITAIFALVAVPLQILIGLGLAMLINSVVRGREIYASLFLIPDDRWAPIIVGFVLEPVFLNPILWPASYAPVRGTFRPQMPTSLGAVSRTWALPDNSARFDI